MSYKCALCGKGPVAGNSVSHSRRATKRVFKPNLSKQRILLAGKKTREYVCTICLKSGKVIKAI